MRVFRGWKVRGLKLSQGFRASGFSQASFGGFRGNRVVGLSRYPAHTRETIRRYQSLDCLGLYKGSLVKAIQQAFVGENRMESYKHPRCRRFALSKVPLNE